ncbi:MAG: proton-conducting transporter membrane subunit [candidate division WOR-3 bacterium]
MEIKNIFLTEIVIFSGIILTLIFYLFTRRIFYFFGIIIISHLLAVFSEFFLLKNNIFGNPYFLNFSYETRIFSLILILSSFISILIFLDYIKKEIVKKEVPFLLLNSLLAMLLLIRSENLFLSFLSLEYLSFTIYIIIAFFKKAELYPELILKYFILGSFSSIFILFGLSLIYLNSGNLGYAFLKEKEVFSLYILSILFLFTGFAFKVFFVPFHLATPDIFESLPFPVVSFISIPTKISLFGFLFSINKEISFDTLSIGIISVIIMFSSNIILIFEKKLKRIFAFSTLLHSGYILLIFLIKSKVLFNVLLFCLIIYTVSHSGLLLSLESFNNEEMTLSDLKNKSSFFLSFASLFFLLSLIGIPPTGGFYAKFFMLGFIISEGYEIFAFITFLNSAISSYYYIKIAGEMFKGIDRINLRFFKVFLIFILLFFTFLLGIYPQVLNFLMR